MMDIHVMHVKIAQFASAVFCVLTIASCHKIDTSSNSTGQMQVLANTPKRSVKVNNHKAADDKLINVATINTDDRTVEKVRESLNAANIQALIGGSRSYGIRVREEDHERALSILEDDAKKHHYWILLDR